MRKVMLSVAPVAATDSLINPRAIARDVTECYKNGAAMVHLHGASLNMTNILKSSVRLYRKIRRTAGSRISAIRKALCVTGRYREQRG